MWEMVFNNYSLIKQNKKGNNQKRKRIREKERKREEPFLVHSAQKVQR